MSDWVSAHKEGCVLHLVVQPKASRSEIVGPHGEGAQIRLKIRVAAPPVDGEANLEVVRFLKKTLKPWGVREFRFLRGEESKQKDLLCIGMTVEILKSAIQSLISDESQ